LQTFLYYPFRVFGPVIESESVKDAFVTEDPDKLMKDGKMLNVPWLVTHVADEGGYSSGELLKESNDHTPYMEHFLNHFEDLAPIELLYGERMNEDETESYTETLKQRYGLFDNKESMMKTYDRIHRMFSDELFLSAINKTIELHRDHSESKVYAYLYDNPAPYGLAGIISNRTDLDFGTCHGDDVFLIYNLPLRGEFRKDEEIISKKLIDMVQNFAINGKLVYGDLEVPANVPNSKKVTYLKITRERTSIVIEDD